MSIDFDSTSLAATEQFLNRNYTTMKIGNATDAPVRSTVSRELLGEVSLDRLELGFEMSYDAEPLGRICLCAVESGSVEEHHLDAGADRFEPGDIGILTPPQLPYSGVIHSARYTITMFDPAHLGRVVDADPATTVELTGHRPVSVAAGRRLNTILTHLRQLAAEYHGEVPPLVAATGTQYLAAAVLETFPNTAGDESADSGRTDAHPAALRRALSYMETRVHDDIAVSDIAAAAYISVRALQLAFRRHLGTTPMAHLTRLRLHGAHEQLIAGGDATVAAIATGWGFGHAGRFAALYRRHYGRSPATTLSGRPDPTTNG
ncbi:AraC family transcriptional regulator [Nocardia sp. alder85J]|uniref:AraC family transcriptional regulator n=1 Tax=Nocardia sp. alder85J TaxID=2862949 RepID=UPI001CD74ADB|nr:helix-turn-helix domain-containing protein [Nocardia sp. alder85J]MCX4092985.1 helix-turn-helix domain-containing protein [Nocardia sp. alder85J]